MTTIAITFALPAESSAFLRRLRNKSRAERNGIRIIRANLEDREVEILHTGVGELVCRQRMAAFLHDRQFEYLISAGFAGALNDQFKVGDLLLAENFSTISFSILIASPSCTTPIRFVTRRRFRHFCSLSFPFCWVSSNRPLCRCHVRMIAWPSANG